MKPTTSLLICTLLFTLPGSNLASAQPPALGDALRDCLALTDNLARLTCYDNLARTQAPAPVESAAPSAAPPVSNTAAAAAPPLTAPATPAPATAPPVVTDQTPVATFGQPAARVESDPEGTEVLVDSVAEARRVEPTKWLLTLKSGQVWRQSVGKSYLIRPGDTVRISPTSWGSDYRLSVEGRRGYIQVTRQE